jgi:hypothetical protein
MIIDFTAGEDMVYCNAMVPKLPTDENGPVALCRVFLCTHDCNPLSGKAIDQPLDSSLEI